MKNNYVTQRRNRILAKYRSIKLLEDLKKFLIEMI